MNLSLRPEHLKRYKDFARLLFKYGRRDLVARAGLNELLPQEAEEDNQEETHPQEAEMEEAEANQQRPPHNRHNRTTTQSPWAISQPHSTAIEGMPKTLSNPSNDTSASTQT